MTKNKNILVKKLLTNLTFGLITIIYLIFISIEYVRLDSLVLIQYINASIMLFLVISIIMMEIAYRKREGLIFFNGLEFLATALFILLAQHMAKVLNCSVQVYTLAGSSLFAIYYILKSAILYTKSQQEKLKDLSDIKDIVKDEPIKKVSKRKNKKVEEGN